MKNRFDDDRLISSVFASEFQPSYSLLFAFVIPFCGSFIYFLTIAAIGDGKNMNIGSSLAPLYIGLALTTVSLPLSLTHQGGLVLNPSVDFGQRFLAWIYFSATWGPACLSYLANCAGTVAASTLYFTVIVNRMSYRLPGDPVGSKVKFAGIAGLKAACTFQDIQNTLEEEDQESYRETLQCKMAPEIDPSSKYLQESQSI